MFSATYQYLPPTMKILVSKICIRHTKFLIILCALLSIGINPDLITEITGHIIRVQAFGGQYQNAGKHKTCFCPHIDYVSRMTNLLPEVITKPISLLQGTDQHSNHHAKNIYV